VSNVWEFTKKREAHIVLGSWKKNEKKPSQRCIASMEVWMATIVLRQGRYS